MALDATARRRWFGALVLLAALAMLVIGQTSLKSRLEGLGFVCYWALCFGLTIVAIVVALLDARALQSRTRREQRDLFESALKELEREAESKSRQRDTDKS